MEKICKCSKMCLAVVKSSNKEYARGHSPDSHKDYAIRAIKISKSQKRNFKNGRINPWKGKKHSRQTKLICSQKAKLRWKNDYEGMMELMEKRGKDKQWQKSNRENVKLATKAWTGRHHTVKHRRKMSALFPSILSKGRTGRAGKTFKYKGVSYRSSWEVAFVKELIRCKTSFEYEKHTFKFARVRSKPFSYTPDFYLPSKGVYVEIKGMTTSKSWGKKLVRLHTQYPNVRILVFDYKRLQQIGVLK